MPSRTSNMSCVRRAGRAAVLVTFFGTVSNVNAMFGKTATPSKTASSWFGNEDAVAADLKEGDVQQPSAVTTDINNETQTVDVSDTQEVTNFPVNTKEESDNTTSSSKSSEQPKKGGLGGLDFDEHLSKMFGENGGDMQKHMKQMMDRLGLDKHGHKDGDNGENHFEEMLKDLHDHEPEEAGDMPEFHESVDQTKLCKDQANDTIKKQCQDDYAGLDAWEAKKEKREEWEKENIIVNANGERVRKGKKSLLDDIDLDAMKEHKWPTKSDEHVSIENKLKDIKKHREEHKKWKDFSEKCQACKAEKKANESTLIGGAINSNAKDQTCDACEQLDEMPMKYKNPHKNDADHDDLHAQNEAHHEVLNKEKDVAAEKQAGGMTTMMEKMLGGDSGLGKMFNSMMATNGTPEEKDKDGNTIKKKPEAFDFTKMLGNDHMKKTIRHLNDHLHGDHDGSEGGLDSLMKGFNLDDMLGKMGEL